MNGRLYDPVLGRFHSPDNFVQMPDFSQSFNRYSYCLNNPLKYTDPNGESITLAAIIGAVVGAYVGGVATNKGELNPLKWNYGQLDTYLGLFAGGIFGGVAGSIIGGSTLWTTSFTFSTPYAAIGTSLGVSASSLGVGTKWKFNFHWTTIAGGVYDSTEKAVKKAVNRVERAFDNYVNQYHQHMANIHAGLDVICLLPGGDIADLANAGFYLLEGDYSNAGLSAAAIVPFFGAIATSGRNAQNAAQILSKYGSKYTNSSLKHGQEIHKMYKVNDIGNNMVKEYSGIKGYRPDLVDFQNNKIYELKPYNPRAVRN